MPEFQQSVKLLRDEISSESYGPEVRKELTEVQGRLSAVSYSREEHARLKQRLSELFHLAEKARDVRPAESELPHLLRKLEELSQEEKPPTSRIDRQ